jgi:hypothetical protein
MYVNEWHRIIRTAALIRQKKGMILSPSVYTHAGSRPLKIGLSCTAAVGGGRNNMPHTAEIVAPPDFHPFMFAGPN